MLGHSAEVLESARGAGDTVLGTLHKGALGTISHGHWGRNTRVLGSQLGVWGTLSRGCWGTVPGLLGRVSCGRWEHSAGDGQLRALGT